MEVTIEEAIQHIKNSCYIVGYPIHDRQNETRKRINASLDMAIEIMRKYQRIQAIINNAKDLDGAVKYNWLYEQIGEVTENGYSIFESTNIR